MIAAEPPPVVERPAAIRFAPPVGEVLRYETRVERQGAHGAIVLRMTHLVRFLRDGAGWRMAATQTDHDVTGSGSAAALMEVALAPMRGVPVTIAIGRDGVPGGVIDAPAAWARVVEGRRAAAAWIDARPGLSAEVRAALRAMLARDDGADAAAREALLAEWPIELLAAAAAALPAAGSAEIADGPLAGTARFVGGDAATLRWSIDLAGPGAARHDELAIDRATGLVTRIVSRRGTGDPARTGDAIVRTIERIPAGG